MGLKATKNEYANQEESIKANTDVQEFYLMEKLYHVMVNDKNRNKKLLNS